MQHMTMGVFRTVENRRALVRSTNGGMTVIVSPNGRILQMLKPFVEGFLIGRVPVVRGITTPYTRYGDWMGEAALGLSILAVLLGGALMIARRRVDRRNRRGS
jgi:apolipoprotein N-acyltransferase